MKHVDWSSRPRRPHRRRRSPSRIRAAGILLAVAAAVVVALVLVLASASPLAKLKTGWLKAGWLQAGWLKPPSSPGPVVLPRTDPDAQMSPGAEPDAPPYIVPPEWRGPGDAGPSTMGRTREAELAEKVKQYGLKLVSGYSTNFYHAIPSQENNIALTADRLRGTLLEPGETFSQNQRLGPYTKEHGYGLGRMFVGDRIVPSIGGGVCQIASTLYNAALLADLKIVERHPHSLVVPYLTPGRDATVTDTGNDFVIRNSSGGPVLIWAWARNRWLTIQIYAEKEPPQIEIKTEILKVYPFQTITSVDASVPHGQTVEDAKGQDGARSRTWLVIQAAEGGGQVTKDLGIDDYKSSPRILRVGK